MRVSASLRRRIDRLSRSAHRFHRFAHHPLCSDYASELIPLGRRVRVCRGCAYVGLGLCTGLLASTIARLDVRTAWFVALGSLAWIASAMVVRRRGAGIITLPKLATRLLPASSLGCALGAGVQTGPTGWLLTATVVVAIAGLTRLYKRRGPDRTPCLSCPERTRETPCRGFSPIVRRERAFQRLTGQWLAREQARSVGP